MANIGISLVAGIIYIVDLDRNLVEPCGKTMYSTCTDQHYVTVGVSRSALSDETYTQCSNVSVKCSKIIQIN